MLTELPSRAEAARELRPIADLTVFLLIGAVALGLVLLAYDYVASAFAASWQLLPLPMQITVEFAIVIAGIAAAATAVGKVYRDYQGRKTARTRARELPPGLEVAAGSVTQLSLTRSDLLDPPERTFLAENRRQYLIRPRDASPKSRRSWGAPVVFVEPTRAGDTRLGPVLALAAAERKKHIRNLRALTAGVGQLSFLRVLIGFGQGYTSLTRAHALRDHLAQTPAKFRMNCIVLDPRSNATTDVRGDESEVSRENDSDEASERPDDERELGADSSDAQEKEADEPEVEQ